MTTATKSWATKDRTIDTIVDCIILNHEAFDTDPDREAIACELSDDLWKLDLRTIETIAAALRTMITVAGRALNDSASKPKPRSPRTRKVKKPALRPFY